MQRYLITVEEIERERRERRAERERLANEDFERYLRANIESNKLAAIKSPQNADWSNGVAAGFEAALEKHLETVKAIKVNEEVPS